MFIIIIIEFLFTLGEHTVLFSLFSVQGSIGKVDGTEVVNIFDYLDTSESFKRPSCLFYFLQI